MKFSLENREVKDLTQADPRTLIADLVLSAPVIYEDGEAEAIISKAVERLAQIEANGLKVCRHQNGALRGFVLTTLDLSPYTVGQHIDSVLDKYYYVNSAYYGKESDPKGIDHGFAEADLGSVFFIAEAADISKTPNNNSDIPGSLCANTRWGDERDQAFRVFCAEFQAAGEGRAVNYHSHSLIYLHDLKRNLFTDTLGADGWIDYIQQPYDIGRDLCPCGGVDCVGRPIWDADSAGAGGGYVAAFLVR
ncbi:MAG: hypothetical protein LBM12_00005 [Candidatus Nomurabacteria bacterium]|jgi:hypothetical protein|nr:hypothetical protein [Candidatus Nomurabacteria bacterium]